MIKATVFDLGGVLVKLGGLDLFRRTMTPHLSHEAFHEKWLFSPSVRAHETGVMLLDDFVDAWRAEWLVTVPHEQVKKGVCAFISEDYTGMTQLLGTLNLLTDTAILSNVSAWHWQNAIERFPMLGSVKHAFLSYEEGLIKPDEACFNALIHKVGLRPEDMLFFDDNPFNIETANRLGMQAHRVDGCMEAVPVLQEFGILPKDWTIQGDA